jgi:hypothetical protein
MNHIDGFFAKFKSAFAGLSNKKEVIVASCKSCVGLDITPEQIEIRGKIVRLNIGSSAKSVLFMKKADVLSNINQKIKPAIVDIC